MLHSYGQALYRHARLVIALWAIVVLVALPLAPRVFGVLAAGGFSSPDLEAARAGDLLTDRFQANPATLFVVYRDPTGTLSVADPRFQQQVAASLADVPSVPEVAQVISPLENARQIAPDGTAAYAVIALRTIPEDFRRVLPAVQGALRPTGLEATITGAPAVYSDIQEVTERDLRRAEIISFPFAALALILIFGSLVAAVVPGIVGGTAVLVAIASMVLLTRVTDLSIFALNLTTMLGLGLGIDYSLFIVSRFREELHASPHVGSDRPSPAGGRGQGWVASEEDASRPQTPGREHVFPGGKHLARTPRVADAVARAVSTAGAAVLFSGSTVFVGLLGLLLFDIKALHSLGIAGSLVVALSVVAALTLLPAILSLLGPRIDALPIGPLFDRLTRHGDQTDHQRGFWARLADRVMAYPVRVLVPVLVLLVGLGLPFLGVEFGAPDASILPGDVQSRRGFDLLREHWGDGELSPILVVLQTRDGTSPLTAERVGVLYDFVRRIQADPRVDHVESIVSIDPRLTREQYELLYSYPLTERSSDVYARVAAETTVRDDVVVIRATSHYGQTDDRSKELVRSIRATAPPAGFDLLVGGGTAGVIDYADRLYAEFPRVAALVIAAIYLVLLVTFRSVVIPLKAVLMNTLSILASYGALVAIFQDGLFADVLRFRPLGFVEASLPIVMFCVLFGLSMDYEVFLLSRVKEAYDKGAGNRASVALGLERSGRIITSAAAIVVLVSLSFVAADIVLIKALGLGTAIAVFLDATIVRALLVPATMRLLGDWNWWAPEWLRRVLPDGGFQHD